VQRGGAHYPQIWGAPDQDQVLKIKNSNRIMIFQTQVAQLSLSPAKI
jgi:hypothetical protein